jgi:hypothetical protein
MLIRFRETVFTMSDEDFVFIAAGLFSEDFSRVSFVAGN